jgi:hypothetical protein
MAAAMVEIFGGETEEFPQGGWQGLALLHRDNHPMTRVLLSKR